jgi:thioredoxin-like negative regulator of GroEL
MKKRAAFGLIHTIAVVMSALAATVPQAARLVPKDDSAVLYAVPAAAALAAQKVRTERARLATRENSPELAVTIARTYIQTARSEGDPRYLSYAQAALVPWREESSAPATIRLMRATIAQSQHRFDAALADLDAVLSEQPGNAQARLTRAAVRMVTGNSGGAQADCAALPRTLATLAIDR